MDSTTAMTRPTNQLTAVSDSASVCYFSTFIFNDFRQTDYLHIYRADARQVFTVDRTVVVVLSIS